MSIRLRCSGLAVFLCLASSLVHAASVQVEGGRATGILGLEVNNQYFDVHFEYASYVEIWGFGASTFGETCSVPGGSVSNPHPCGPGDSSGALAAADAINIAFDMAGVSGLDTTDGSAHNFYTVAYLFDWSSDSYVRSAYVGAGWQNQGDGFCDCFPNVRPYAVFEPSAVPVPAAVWLFVSGLGALVWRRNLS